MSIANDIMHEYLQVSRLISEKFRVYYGKLNLTYPQSIVLAILVCDGPMPISALADAAGSANSTISGVVDRLERMGLVERIRSDNDRRVIFVDVTEKFKKNFSELKDSSTNQFAEILSKMSDEDCQSVLRGLQLLSKAMSQD